MNICMYIYIYVYVQVCVPKNNLPLLQSSILKTAYLEKHVRRISQIHSAS